jgi:hypothetical protein
MGERYAGPQPHAVVAIGLPIAGTHRTNHQWAISGSANADSIQVGDRTRRIVEITDVARRTLDAGESSTDRCLVRAAIERVVHRAHDEVDGDLHTNLLAAAVRSTGTRADRCSSKGDIDQCDEFIDRHPCVVIAIARTQTGGSAVRRIGRGGGQECMKDHTREEHSCNDAGPAACPCASHCPVAPRALREPASHRRNRPAPAASARTVA